MDVLRGVTTTPILRPDGSLLDKPGLDPATQMLFMPGPDSNVAVPHAPTIEQVRQAVELLWRPFDSFPFVDNASRGVHLAALLAASTLGTVPTMPAMAYDAPTAGSGKTLLCQCVAALTGVPAANIPTAVERSRWLHA